MAKASRQKPKLTADWLGARIPHGVLPPDTREGEHRRGTDLGRRGERHAGRGAAQRAGRQARVSAGSGWNGRYRWQCRRDGEGDAHGVVMRYRITLEGIRAIRKDYENVSVRPHLCAT